MERTIIATEKAPGAVGPYSQAVTAGGLVFTAGQIPINPATGKVEAESIEDQTRQVLKNIRALLHAAGSGLDRVVKMTVFMTDLEDFQAMNAAYAEFFPAAPPARSAVQVVALPLGVQIEVEAVALIS
ncbi:MAG: RidA family protein [Thermoanaerobaculales bacterium]